MAKRARAQEPMYRVWRPDVCDEEDGIDLGALDVASAARIYAERKTDFETTFPIVVHVRNSITNEVLVVGIDREMVPEYIASKPLPVEMKPAVHALWGGRALCMDIRLDKPPGQWPDGQFWVDVKAWDDKPPTQKAPPKCAACDKRVAGVRKALASIGVNE